MDNSKTALVIQGGGTRAAFCLGVLFALFNDGFHADCIYGTSAGALVGMNWVLGDVKRGEALFLSSMSGGKFASPLNLLRLRSLFDFNYFFNVLSKDVFPFSLEDFLASPVDFDCVATSCNTGKAVHFKKTHPEILKAIEASCALPLVSKPVIVGGEPYLDGGTVESIPYLKAIEDGYSKIVVISSRCLDFRKEGKHPSHRLLAKAEYLSYPKWQEAFLNSVSVYNESCDKLAALVKENKVFVISPSTPPIIGHAETDLDALTALEAEGCKEAKKRLEELHLYLSKDHLK